MKCELSAQLGVDLVEDALVVPSASWSASLERAQGGAAQGVDGEVPGAEGVDAEVLARRCSWRSASQRDDDSFDGVSEAGRRRRPVVEPFAVAVGVVGVVVEAGLGGDLDAEGEHLVEQVVELVAVDRGGAWRPVPRLPGGGRGRFPRGRATSGRGCIPCPGR